MNRITAAAISAATVFLLACCSRTPEFANPTGWKAECPGRDSLTREIELAFLFEEHPDSIELLMNEYLGTPAHENDSREVSARMHFWKGRLASRRKNPALRACEYDSAVKTAPEATAEYIRHRLQWNDERRPDYSAEEWYAHKLEEVEYFKSRNDYIMLFHQYRELMDLMREIGLRDRAWLCHDLCDESNRHIGARKYQLDHKINLAALLSDDGEFEKAAALNREILHDSLFMKNHTFYQLVNFNLYLCDLDTAALYNAYSSLLEHGDRVGRLPRVFVSLVMDAVDRGDSAAAAEYIDSLAPRIEEIDLGTWRLQAFKAMALGKELCGDSREALEAYRHYAAAADSLVDDLRHNNIANIEIANSIARIDDGIKRERKAARLRQWLLGGAACLTVALIIGLYYRRTRHLKLQRELAEEQKLAAEQRQIAVQLGADRRELALQKAVENLHHMKSSGKIPAAEIARLEHILSDKGITEIGCADFLELFSRQYPMFIGRLREMSPKISDSALRLAGYIAIGLGTKEVSELMNVRPESVRQARWRLRRTLGLEKEEDLFPLLSGLLRQNH